MEKRNAFAILLTIVFFAAAQRTHAQDAFIDVNNIIFHDDFQGEKLGEFPRKWSLVSGALQTAEVDLDGEKKGVIEMLSSRSTIRPSFEKPSYLGTSFKIELQCLFYGVGNEAYYLNLYDEAKSTKPHKIAIRSEGVKNGSDEYTRMPGDRSPGWRTVQLSFNKGNLKIFYNGHQLVNQPALGPSALSHLEIHTLSFGSTKGDRSRKAKINYFTIAKEGLPLYDRLISTGRIIVQNIHFDVDSYVIKPSSYDALEEIITILNKHPALELTIEGHTDSDGDMASNQLLSENRANAVKDYLFRKKIKRSRLASKGYGAERPLKKGDTPEAKAENRRVEFVVYRSR